MTVSDSFTASKVTISVAFEGEIVLTVDEVWPDGDAPEVITAEAVRDVMRASGSKLQVLQDWCLTDAIQVVAIVDDRSGSPRRHEAEEVWG